MNSEISSSGSVGAGKVFARPDDDGRLLPATVTQVDPNVAKNAVVENPGAQRHELKSDSADHSAAIVAGGQSTQPNDKVGGKQTESSVTSQHSGDTLSANASGHGQENADGSHRGSSDERGEAADRLRPTPESSSGVLGTVAPGASTHGHGISANPGHLDPVRESPAGTDLKNLPSARTTDASATRLVANAMRGDLRVGVHTEAFGRVTIETNAQGGQLSAQLSLENAKDSATLAAHLPVAEQKIVQQHGLTASVRLVGGFDGAGAGSMGRDQSGSSQGDAQRYRNDSATRVREIDRSPPESRITESRPLSSYRVSSRLDVMA